MGNAMARRSAGPPGCERGRVDGGELRADLLTVCVRMLRVCEVAI